MKKEQQIKHEEVVNTKIKNYLICEELGNGASARVYMAIQEETNEQVAIKVIPKSYLNSDEKLLELVKTEIYVLKTCCNDNVIKFHNVLQSSLSIFIVTEYCNGGDMEKYIRNKDHLSEDHAVWYLKQILNGFKGLHEIGAMHRDFKLSNILLKDRECKIADLGFAKQMKDQDLTDTILGTQMTMAPEVLERRPYGINADIWSLGIVFYYMLTGKYPYNGLNSNEILKNIKSKTHEIFGFRLSPMACDFIQGCLTYDPNKRITWKEIYKHPLLNKSAIELTYGISKTAQTFTINESYYKNYRNSFESYDERESLTLLRQSARKEVINEEIFQLISKVTKCKLALRSSIDSHKATNAIRKLSINYGTYLNQLSYPMKFLTLHQAEKIPNVEHESALYLIFKNCLSEVSDFLYIVRKRINIFKIEVLWNEYIKNPIYEDLENIARSCVERADKIFQEVENKLKKKYANLSENDVQNDKRIAEELNHKGIKRESFTNLLEHYKYEYCSNMMRELINESSPNINSNLIEMCEALVYYNEPTGKTKESTERFDWNRSNNVNYDKLKMALISKWKEISIHSGKENMKK